MKKWGTMANGSAEGDNALPMHRPSLFDFFSLWFFLLLCRKKGVTFCNNMIHMANDSAEGDGALPMQGTSLFDFFSLWFLYCLERKKRLTAVLNVTALCPCKGIFCSIFFALLFILLWTGKKCDLCLIPMRMMKLQLRR
ncbi:hypothetical protein GLYMA_01G095298v4 [Glycine max]|nr:hypothetical protein GLYMA_01G095298v4 [Glycine max]